MKGAAHRATGSAMIRNAGIAPHVIEYRKTPRSRALLEQLVARVSITPPHAGFEHLACHARLPAVR
ncbi:hypothetical protein EAO27_07020 [Sphingopyxis sp. YF1]|nr:hypothetical protein EAO27_07020 [Sphingopyxis sp. YF1]